jgi:hypothetical protein
MLNDSFTQEVWASNLEVEMAKIRDLVDVYPFVAMVK